MTTSEAIKILKELDPSGNEQLVCRNQPIFFIEKMPAYYDGAMQVLITDKSKDCYNVIGGKYVRDGCKVQIVLHSLEDAIFENPDLPIESPIINGNKRYNEEIIERWRKEAREMKEKYK